MKKGLFALLVTVAIIFSVTACTETYTPNLELVDEIYSNNNGEVPENKSDENPEICSDCEEPNLNCVCEKISKINGFNISQGERGSRELINIYTFTDETVDMINFFLLNNLEFSEKYFIQLKFSNNAETHRASVALNIDNDGEDGIDLFLADVDYAMEFADLPGTATIAELGIVMSESDYYTYTLDLMRKGDALMGLSHQATPGAMYYRADIAAKVFGIKSENEMQELVSDWDGFIEVAQKIVDETDFKILAGADELKRNFLNARTQGWVIDGKFNIDYDTIEEFVQVTGAIADMGGLKVNSGGQQFSTSWEAGMSDGVFAYFGSTWYLHYILKGQADDSFGKWGMIPGPQEFYWGGTYWFGSKSAASNKLKAEAVKQIIEFFCVDDESIIAYMTKTGDFPSKKTVLKSLSATDEQKSFFLYKTDHYPVFAEIADRIDISRNVTKYDAFMDKLFDTFINNIFSDGLPFYKALDILSTGVRENAPPGYLGSGLTTMR